MRAVDARTMEQLIAAVNAGSPVKYLFFWGHTRKAGADLGSWVFSQWFPAPFEVDGEVRHDWAQNNLREWDGAVLHPAFLLCTSI